MINSKNVVKSGGMVLTQLDLKVLWHIKKLNAEGKPCTVRAVMRAMRYKNVYGIFVPLGRLLKSGLVTREKGSNASIICHATFIPEKFL